MKNTYFITNSQTVAFVKCKITGFIFFVGASNYFAFALVSTFGCFVYLFCKKINTGH